MMERGIKAVKELIKAMPTDPNQSLDERRAAFDGMSALFPIDDNVAISEVDADGIPGLWIVAPGAKEDRAVLYLHGGGYIVGSPLSHRHMTAAISEATGAAVLSVDYRLAPENPYPAAVEDAVAAYHWLVKEKGVSPNSIAISGDSAGGGLTIATLMMLRDREIGEPAAGMVISPWVDLTGESKSCETRAALDPMIDPVALVDTAKQYLGGKNPKEAHLASPAFGRMDGLPPLLIQVGTDEVLYDDALMLAGKAASVHVDVTLEIWDDMVHVWHMFLPMLDEAQQAIDKMGAFYKAKVKA